MICKFYEFNSNLDDLDKEYQVLMDVFNEIVDMDGVEIEIKPSIFSEIGKNFVVVNIYSELESKIKSIRRSDVFFRVEKLTNYRIEDLKQIKETSRSSRISKEDLFIQVYYHWIGEDSKSTPILPRNSSMVDFEP